MKRLRILTLGCLLVFLVSAGLYPPSAGGASGTVVVIPVQSEISPATVGLVRRGLSQAAATDAGAVILEIKTPGGLIESALQIRDLVTDSDRPVIAFVQGRAWSAGALIALAADHLVMAPGSSMGAAEPIPATPKILSAWKGEMEATAGRNGRDPAIAGAMVDKGMAIPGLVAAGDLLTLTADQAKAVGYADLLAGDRNAVLEFYGLADLTVVEVNPSWAEQLAAIITQSSISPLLLIVGFTGLILELFIPGWGIAGIIGLLSLVLFFGGHMLAGLAGWEAIASFIIGLVLLFLEVFVTPGFGVMGVSGLFLLGVSIFLASGDPVRALRTLLTAIVGTGLAVVLMARYFKESRLWQRIRLGVSLNREGGYQSALDMAHLVGRTGVTVSMLRPAGIALIEGSRLDVISEGTFIPPNQAVEVVKVEGSRIIVRPVEEK